MIMAEAIVMIHGMWGGAWYWENYKNLFEQKGLIISSSKN
jgi:hypothetical protein